MKPKVVLVAAIARGHAIAKKLAETAEVHSLIPFANPGIVSCSKSYELGNIVDPQAVAAFAKKIKPEYVFIAPDDPIAAGAADTVEEEGFPAVAPVKAVARLESDKAFAREFMREYVGEGCPRFETFEDEEKAKECIDSLPYDFVVKPAGLTGGKGVKVMGLQLHSKQDAKAYVAEALQYGGRVVIEEKLDGEEFSLQCFVDGKTFKPMPLAQDHKPAFEGDQGPMTGGMGSYSCEDHLLPFVANEDYAQALDIVKKTVDGVRRKTGQPYKGILYAQFIVTKDGPYIIEYNARFGDPEAENVLPLLKTDLHEICKAIVSETLEDRGVAFEKKAAVCKYVVPEGYPERKDKFRFSVDESKLGGVELCYSGVEQKPDGLYTTGSRAYTLTSVRTTLDEAYKKVEAVLAKLDLRGFRYRKDIASSESIQQKTERMRRLKEI